MRKTIPLIATLLSCGYAFQPFAPILPEAVASGKSVLASFDPKHERKDLQVDLGLIHQVGDEFETDFTAILVDKSLELARKQHPTIKIPEGSVQKKRARIHCGQEGFIASTAEITILSPTEVVLYHHNEDAAKSRRYQEGSKLHSDYPFNYGQNGASLVCWAMARKSENKPVTLPLPEPPTAGGREALLQHAKLFAADNK